MATNPNVLRADEILDLPVPDGLIGYELVDGKPVPVMPASALHGRLIVEVAYRIRQHLERTGLRGEVLSDTGFILGLRRDRERMRAPDVCYMGEQQEKAPTDPERFLRGVPDLAVEIDLTSGKNPGGQQRVLDYLEAGVRLVWAIDPRSRTATVYRPDGSARLVREEEALEGENVLPGFH